MPNQNEESRKDFLDLTTRSILLQPASLRTEDQSVAAVLATEQRTVIFDWRRWGAIEEILIVGGLRNDSQVPLIANHDRSSLDNVFGSVREIRRLEDAVEGRLYFSDQGEEIARAWNKIRQGHLTDVSVGYRSDEYRDLEPGETASVGGRSYTAGRLPLRITTAWQLREVSLVPVGADQAAKIRAEIQHRGVEPGNSATEERTMADELSSKEAPAEAPPSERQTPPLVTPVTEGGKKEPAPVDAEAIRQQAVAEERARQAAIRELARDEIEPDLVKRAISEGWDESRTSREFLAALRAGRPAPETFNVISRNDEATMELLSAGLMLRCGIDPIGKGLSESQRRKREEIADRARPFSDVSLMDLCRYAIQASGRRVPVGRQDTIREAVSGGTLTNIFTTSVNASLLAAFAEAPNTFASWTRPLDVANFMQQDAIDFSETSALAKIPRGGEAHDATIADNLESYKIARYGEKFSIDEQDIIDDRLDAFSRIPGEMGQDCARLVGDLVYALLFANATLNRDGVAVFDSTHGNTDTNVLSIGNLKTGVTKMRKQKRNGKSLNISPVSLLIPPDLEWTAREILNSTQILIAAAGTTDASLERGNRNVVADIGLQPVVEARFCNGVTNPATGTAYSASTTTWFLAASPSLVPTVIVAYRTGTGRSPQLRSYTLDKGRWGVGWDINLDVGAKVLDYLGLYRGNA